MQAKSNSCFEHTPFRRFITSAVAGTAALSVGLSLAEAADEATLREKPGMAQRPNILLILSDDLSYGDLGCLGQERFRTPNLDQLAANGVIFNNAYAGGAWCAPSRTSLLTGLRPDRWSNPRKAYPTIAQMLQKSGYRTGVFGKWHIVDDDKLLPGARGFDTALVGYMVAHPELKSANLNKMNPYFPEILLREDGREVRFPENQKVTEEYVWSYGHSNQREPARTRMYDPEGHFKDPEGNTNLTFSEDVYRDAALDFLRASKDEPFFLYYATALPHSPIGINKLGRFKEMPEEWGLNPAASTTFPRQLWAAMVEEMDRNVGMILDELKASGRDKNTIVIFASDNGYACWGNWNTGERWKDDDFFQHKGPWDRGKFVNANGGLTVPFIASWPGTLPPGENGRAVSFYDFMATFADLAGAELPVPTDGISLAPLLKGHPDQLPLRAEIVFPKEGGGTLKGTHPMNAVLLDEQYYAYTEIGNPEFEDAPIRLFDIRSDPGCENDLSGKFPEMTERALHILRPELAGR